VVILTFGKDLEFLGVSWQVLMLRLEIKEKLEEIAGLSIFLFYFKVFNFYIQQ